jgi:hypothetical protein
MKDRDELAAKQVLGYKRLNNVTFWKITDLYKDTYYFGYVVDEFTREVRRQGCSWVAAPAPRALPILGAVSLKARLPACYIHKKGELPGDTQSVSEGPYQVRNCPPFFRNVLTKCNDLRRQARDKRKDN